ncbi:unnamed protein product [Rotaria magnacalcarata]|uniref:Uncharacterized protein n=1 Tax=Rotaria magnacalcarata TaxID=392030 RepID=A0A816P8Y7_9BILA|nr:unnamed protein product [Rotaria magnacalcarata]CAF1621570.1 unnamed protein product [Rotaria magnacalcarata]CAF2012589.1 unnamed protein product [Rotaria magnacalcarata]CAF2045508.1 unnamed protein product [Rotaria magnacalcarata]CAF2118656.1 unnamed protein product [Rotaria magnacalcarata]
MNIIEEYFWKADMALQMNRLDESCQFICQAIERLDQSHLTLEQLELVWSVIPKIITNHRKCLEHLVYYHRSMPMETDEIFDRLTQSYVNKLEQDQAKTYMKLIDYFDRYLIKEKNDIDHIHLKRLQSDLYLQLSFISRPYQSQLFYNKHRKLLNDIELIINMYKNQLREN